jgi:hypothetical protein
MVRCTHNDGFRIAFCDWLPQALTRALSVRLALSAAFTVLRKKVPMHAPCR